MVDSQLHTVGGAQLRFGHFYQFVRSVFHFKSNPSADTRSAQGPRFRMSFRLEPLFVFIFMLCLLINLFFRLHSQDEHTTRNPKQLFQNNFASGPEHRLIERLAILSSLSSMAVMTDDGTPLFRK